MMKPAKFSVRVVSRKPLGVVLSLSIGPPMVIVSMSVTL